MLLKKLQVHPFDMNAEQIDVDLILDKPKNFNPHAAKLMSRKDDANPDTTLAVSRPSFTLTFFCDYRNWREPLRNGCQKVLLSPASGKISITNLTRVRLTRRKHSITCYQCFRRSPSTETPWQRPRSSSRVVSACLTKVTSNFWPRSRWRFKMKCRHCKWAPSLLATNQCNLASPT